MRDASFTLFQAAADCPPPFGSEVDLTRPGRWRIRDGLGRDVGEARTRLGARQAVRSLYAGQRVFA